MLQDKLLSNGRNFRLFFGRLFWVLELKNVAHFIDSLKSLQSKKRKVISDNASYCLSFLSKRRNLHLPPVYWVRSPIEVGKVGVITTRNVLLPSPSLPPSPPPPVLVRSLPLLYYAIDLRTFARKPLTLIFFWNFHQFEIVGYSCQKCKKIGESPNSLQR